MDKVKAAINIRLAAAAIFTCAVNVKAKKKIESFALFIGLRGRGGGRYLNWQETLTGVCGEKSGRVAEHGRESKRVRVGERVESVIRKRALLRVELCVLCVGGGGSGSGSDVSVGVNAGVATQMSNFPLGQFWVAQ